MIIQLPRNTTSIVLRFDGQEPDQAITLLPDKDPASPPEAPVPPLGRRMLGTAAFTAIGLMVGGLGVSMLSGPRAQPALFMQNQATGDIRPVMPDRMQAELARGPTVLPPDAGPPAPPPGPGHPDGPPPRNPFGLE